MIEIRQTKSRVYLGNYTEYTKKRQEILDSLQKQYLNQQAEIKHQEEVIAFGDGFNDLSMIAYAGLGVAMDNAVDGVKERADMITKSHDDDGIAYALSQIIEGIDV